MNAQIKPIAEVKTYDAIDLQDAHSLACADLNWMHTAINHVRKEVQRIHDLAEKGEQISQYHLSGLIEHLHIYEYLADHRKSYHEGQAEVYELEWNVSK